MVISGRVKFSMIIPIDSTSTYAYEGERVPYVIRIDKNLDDKLIKKNTHCKPQT